eukprot:TRINITY_DN23551_c0_g1_i1.p1 TRINITY_DN23551_c0_g1~~TRINITY_DN23551_c0_g1_i1.p1  ORF type:complete len:530 (-),score=85.43 TRINITY_DN23551_c0_g1_i1:219-1808(-)
MAMESQAGGRAGRSTVRSSTSSPARQLFPASDLGLRSLDSNQSSRSQSLDPDQLLARVRHLERDKQADEKERKLVDSSRKKDMTCAKNKLTTEVRNASRLLRKQEIEAALLERKLNLFEKKAEQARAKRMEVIEQLEREASEAELMCSELRAARELKLAELSVAQSTLAGAEINSKLLELGIVIPDFASPTSTLRHISVDDDRVPMAAIDETRQAESTSEGTAVKDATAIIQTNARLKAELNELRKSLGIASSDSSKEQLESQALSSGGRRADGQVSAGIALASRPLEPVTGMMIGPRVSLGAGQREYPHHTSASSRLSSAGPSRLSSDPLQKNSGSTVTRFSSANYSPSSPATPAASSCRGTLDGDMQRVNIIVAAPSRQQSLGVSSARGSIAGASSTPMRFVSCQSMVLRNPTEASMEHNTSSTALTTPRSCLNSATTTPGVAPSAVVLQSPRSMSSSTAAPLHQHVQELKDSPPVVVYSPWMAKPHALISSPLPSSRVQVASQQPVSFMQFLPQSHQVATPMQRFR